MATLYNLIRDIVFTLYDLTIKGKINTIPRMNIKTTPLILKQSYLVSPTIKHFVFSCLDDKIKNFTAGQFITMHFEIHGKAFKRSYSIANREHNDDIEFAAGYVEKGPATEMLFALAPGDTIDVNGPFGRLTLKEEPVKRYLLIATSTGVTPYRAMMRELTEKLKQDPELSVHILLGVRSPEDLLYRDEFISFTEQMPNAYFHACYSRAGDTEQFSDHEFSGYVQDKLVELNPNPETDIAYLCGNPAMVDACYSTLSELAFHIKQIRREKYISR